MRKILFLLFLALGVMASAQSAVYKQYAGREDIAEAVYMKNHRIAGARVSITLLRATNEQAFDRLMGEFGLRSYDPSPTGSALIALRRDNDPRQLLPTMHGQVKLRNACIIGASRAELTLFVFHGVRNRTRYTKIVNYILFRHNSPAEP